MRRLVLSALGALAVLLPLLGAIVAFRLHGAVLTPSGRFGVGTRTVVWTEPETQWSFPVAFAYPAEGPPAGVAVARAAPLPLPKHPLVVLAPDVGSSAMFYRSIAYELASQGLVVAVVGLPGIERFTRFPDRVKLWDKGGRAADDARNTAGWPRAGSNQDYAAAAQLAAKAMTATLDRINKEAHAKLDPLYISVRVGDVAFVGHGLGGTAALLACRDDTRCDAVATIDGPPLDDVPFAKPLLAVATSDEPRGLEAIVAAATGPTYSAVIDASARLDVTDMGRVVPRLFLPSGSTAQPDRGTRAARDLLVAFSLRHLMQFPVPLLDKSDVLDDVTLTSRYPLGTSN